MRIRYKPWARAELEACPFYIDDPTQYKGKWQEVFEKKQPIHIELGCGKGSFIAELASSHLETNYLAIDMVDAMLGLAKRNIEQTYAAKQIQTSNIYITRFDIERIFLMLEGRDKIERIYINFCNPWPRGKHHKKRLTHTRQLEKYKEFLKDKAQIHFKTDDNTLFNESIGYFKNSGFEIVYQSYDLHAEKDTENIETEHEKMYTEEGIKIKKLIAIYHK